ncbi:MAG: hypothetical protein P8J18_00185 [Halieaceae bacterium]|nr:hypothetical protein [Halieaceae bacterium]
MNDDDLTAIPSISATRDADTGITSRELPRLYQETRGIGAFARLVLTISIVVAAVALAWAWQLQQELNDARDALERYSIRTGDLEDLLSDTDETVNQSATAMRVQLKRLDTENRKLWDARRVSNNKISKLEKTSSAQGANLANVKKIVTKNEKQLPILQEEVSRFTVLAKDLTNLTASAKRNQVEVERVADGINRIDLEQAKLEKRVSENEGWIESINVSRRQVNGKLTQLENVIRSTHDSEVRSNSE